MKRNLSLLLGALAVTAGCQKTESNTELILEISTNIPVPAGMDNLSLKIGSQGKPEALSKTYPLGTGAGQIMLPRRMTLVPTETGTVLNLLVEGLLGTKSVVSRQVITKFAKGESKLLVIELLQKCVGQVCLGSQTCTPSAFCADPSIDPATLPTFDPSKAPNTPGLDPDAGVSIDASSDRLAGDGKLNADQGAGDGQPDGIPNTSETSLDVDAPSNMPDVPPGSKTKGVPCGGSLECESGLCIDGVCCESKCDGLCMACNVPGKLGTCAPVPLNDPANGDCPDDGVASCARNGKCNGQGGCMMVPEGVACSAETCPAGTSSHTRPGLCDGRGHCGPGQLQDCAPFLCNATTKTCNPTCTADQDCVAPNRCINGSCGKKGIGQPCSAPGDCQSNVCAQGVCCAGPCSDLCKSCAVEGKVGTCSAVPAGKPDLQSRCQDQGVASCGSNGLCDGVGACQKYGDNLICGRQCNGAAASLTISICSAGACTPGTPQPCSPYSCDNNGCKKSCTVLSDCAPGFVCDASGLCVRPSEDCLNGIDDDGDTQVDCADSDCQPAFMCVPMVPDGFKGPIELFDGPEADMPSCGGSYPFDHFKGWGSLACPFDCGSCDCGIPKEVTCGNPGIVFADSLTCANLRPSELTPGVCQALVDNTATHFATIAGKASGGTCQMNVPPPTVFPASWNAARACGAGLKGGGGCASGFMCWPAPQKPYQPQACVMGEGNLVCPPNGYTLKRDYFDSRDLKDTRACTNSCGCGTPTNVSCNAVVELHAAGLFGKDPCSSENPTAVKVPSLCQKEPVNIGSVMAKIPTNPFSGGSCAPTGSVVPTGGCEPLGTQATVCCMP